MIKSVAPYIGKYKKYTVAASILTTLGIIANVVPYYFLYQLIIPLTKGELPDFKFVAIRVAAIFVCLTLYAILYSRGLAFSHISAYNTLKNIRISLKDKLENQPLGNIKEIGTGQIKRVFTDDIDQIELLLAHAIPEGIANLTVPCVVILAMFFVEWHLTLLTLAVLPFGAFGMAMMMKAGMSKMGAYYESAKKMNNTIIEYVNGMEAIKVFNKDGDSFRRFGDAVRSYRDFTLAWYKVCWPWMAVYNSTLPCLALFTLPFGALMVLSGKIVLSELVLVLCMSFAVGPAILRALSFGGKIPQLNYKIAELEKLMNGQAIKAGTNVFTGKNYDIEFKNIRFSYKKDEVVHGVNLSLKQGTTTALIGESGSGKSTLAKLLVHFYDLDSGSISIGGQDITDMSIEALNNQISYVAQEQFLFNTSLYENILIGRPDATRDEVLDAAHRAQCDEFLARFPKGIDTMAGDSGKQLSGGERQRISLARAILKNAPVIVLDEATAFMDPENEEKMNAAISEIIKDKTVLVIAHRLSSIKKSDKICVLKEGNVIAEGTHDALINDCEEYKKLWNASKAAAEWRI
ncbi:MAG: ABC transporter ATP-binding protein/permease [Treponema sp.]|uniref:ABC transporter ATP-binding protein n=1 Tax=Treponema sp. TaxID=166 RepID=UPI00298DFCD5|nr:ABC transporter ATP-binding protein [Treponema sp.]MCR5386446.1 ABC transporter ATP-binding protein/permease [Treponema sp.]